VQLGLLRRTPTTSGSCQRGAPGSGGNIDKPGRAENFTKGESKRPRAAASHHQPSVKDGSLRAPCPKLGFGQRNQQSPEHALIAMTAEEVSREL